ncbi:hypothetical protein bcere0016_2170 [Bacillus cereus 95/8201]|nr:hypothetical protein bcere0016_2170 [Bacillus cereus 95/8201]KWU59617.1 hypothetical protein AWW71_15570 [Bacillus cereus]KWW53073.1 hypothetical protein AWW69_19015 [Bacillus cereus]
MKDLSYFVTKVEGGMGMFRYMTVILHECYKHGFSRKCIKSRFLKVFIKNVKKV